MAARSIWASRSIRSSRDSSLAEPLREVGRGELAGAGLAELRASGRQLDLLRRHLPQLLGHVHQRLEEGERVGIAQLAVLLETPQNEVVQLLRHAHLRVPADQRLRRFGEPFEDETVLILGIEGRLAGDHLVQHGGKRVEVAAVVERRVLDRSRLLGRAVHELAHEDAGLGDFEAGLDLEVLRQAEIDELHLVAPAAIAGDHHVVGRDVAMDHAGGVDRLEPAQSLDPQVHRQGQRKDPVGFQPFVDILALDVLRNHVEAAVRQTGEVVEDGDVRVLDLGGDARFLGEALQGVRIGRPIGAQDLDDPQLLQVDVARAPDLAHPSRGETVEDLVLAVEDRPAIAFGHRGSWLLGPSVR